MSWRRVNHHEPCIICFKGDWCTRNSEGVCCMRVESDRPLRNGGWLHNAATIRKRTVVRVERDPQSVDWRALLTGAIVKTTAPMLRELSESLGVKASALESMGACWFESHNAWAFPMRDANENLIGMRLRYPDGTKSSIRHSHSGLFIPNGTPAKDLWITEGPTDCAAALTLGKWAIGRPSCLGCERLITYYVKQHRFTSVKIIADQGEPGQRGAEKLSALIHGSTVWTPDAKDLREFVKCGGVA